MTRLPGTGDPAVARRSVREHPEPDSPARGPGRFLTPASAAFVAVVLLFAGADKLFHYSGFVRALESYVVVPEGWAPFLALPVILVELLVGLGLLLPAWRRTAAAGAAVLLGVFTGALLINRQLAPEAPCGCTFTLTLGEGDGVHLALNLLLIAIALGVALDPSTARSTGVHNPGAVPGPSNPLRSKEDP